jgi:GT2 family glycosyltransferase
MNWCLIVATHGRRAELARLLDSLLVQSEHSFRVIIVDQNPPGFLESTLSPYLERMPIDHVVIESHGVSHARNAGLALLADESFIAFPDDDCYYSPETLSGATHAFDTAHDADAIIAHWRVPGAADAQRASDRMVPRAVGRYRCLVASPTFVLFFRRAAVTATGAFDETLGPGGGTPWLCGEDADYLLRAGGLRGRAAYAAGVEVFHPRADATTQGYEAKAFGYGRGRMRVLAKHAYPFWFRAINLLHPLAAAVFAPASQRRFRWHLFRGRLHEWLHPHVLESRE